MFETPRDTAAWVFARIVADQIYEDIMREQREAAQGKGQKEVKAHEDQQAKTA